MEQKPSINVMITNVCPNKCKYCFAPVVIPHDKVGRALFMSLDDFLYVLSFIKRSKLKNVRLLGGEPLIHQDIKQFLEEIKKDDDFTLLTIFTSGIFPPKIIEHLEDDKITVIVNCNHPKDYDPLQHRRFLSNLEIMADKGIRFILGYNIYEQDFDYSPIIELCTDLAVDTLRICIANPTISKTVQFLDLEQRRKIGHRIYSLVMECVNKAINVIFDCIISPCIFTDKQWGSITKFYPHIADSYAVCTPIIDVSPDLRVSRCFATDYSSTIRLRQFDNSEELWRFFYEQVDSYKWHAVEGKCKNCKYFTSRVCQGSCLGFLYPKIAALKEKQNESKGVFNEAFRCLRSQDFDSAIAKFEQGLRLYNGDSAIICDYVFALLKNSQFGKAQSAVNYYDRILSVDKSGVYPMVKGLLAEARKDHKNAIKFYRRAVREVDKNKKEQLLKRIKRVKGLEK